MPGQDAIEELDHGHLGAEAAPDRAQLEPDHAGADDQQPLRHFVEASAPVEDTMRFSSISMPGRRATSEPVAITMAFVSSLSRLPSLVLHSDRSARRNAACALERSRSCSSKQERHPLDVALYPLVLEFIIAGRSSLGLPTLMPMRSNRWPASS